MPFSAIAAAVFSTDAAVSPHPGASTTPGNFPSAENPAGRNIFP
jgi:hypothetical protein